MKDVSALQLVSSKIRNGVWHGLVTGAQGLPRLEVRHLEKPVPDVTLLEGEAGLAVQVPIPAEAITDGVQTFMIVDAETEATIGSFTLIAGEALGDDIRAEVDLLRAELDMLKRAFRRHCVETG